MREADIECDNSYLQRVKNIHDVCGEYDYTTDGISGGGDANSDTWHRILPTMRTSQTRTASSLVHIVDTSRNQSSSTGILVVSIAMDHA